MECLAYKHLRNSGEILQRLVAILRNVVLEFGNF